VVECITVLMQQAAAAKVAVAQVDQVVLLEVMVLQIQVAVAVEQVFNNVAGSTADLE
jgi:hypothetical protein